MAFSLSSWFKGKPESESGGAPAENGEGSALPPGAPFPRTAHVPPGRVTARVVRTVTPQPPQPKVTVRAPSARQAIALPVEGLGESGENAVRTASAVPQGRKISFGAAPDALGRPFGEMSRGEVEPSAPQVPAGPDLPVILEVGDFVDRLPSSLLQSGALDRKRRVEFRASELYSDLTKGRASVPASIIYQKCADIFSRPITATEDIEVALPLQKLVEQMSTSLQTRQDQVAAENVGEIETPFLQVALEDNARLPAATGTSTGPIAAAKAPVSAAPFPVPAPPFREHHPTGQISTISPMKLTGEVALAAMPPSPQAIGGSSSMKRPPATVRASVAGAKIRVAGSPSGNRTITPIGPSAPGDPGSFGAAPRPPSIQEAGPLITAAPAASPSHQVAKKTARIQIPPISLRPAGEAAKAVSLAPPSAPMVPLQPSPVSVRPAPTGNGLPTFRSNPGLEGPEVAKFRSTPPPAIKPPPPSFSPRRTVVVPPASSALPPAGTSKPAEPGAPTLKTPPAAATPSSGSGDDRQIVLKLAVVLRGFPAIALATDPSNVPDEAVVALPFRLIEPQLSSGRVAVPFQIFLQALPETDRGFIIGDAGLAEVPLPLAEIFHNLPSSALSIRADQVVEEAGTSYLTPFSQKAEEDAVRFGAGEPSASAAVVEADPELARDAGLTPSVEPLLAESASTAAEHLLQRPAEAAEVPREAEQDELSLPAQAFPAEIKLPEITVAAPAEPAALVDTFGAVKPEAEAKNGASHSQRTPAILPSQTVLQTIFMTEDELDAKTVVKLVSQLPGINGCAVMFGDGLQLAGNFPENG